jgi:hypothetical protein
LSRGPDAPDVYSREYALVSLAVGAGCVLALELPVSAPLALVWALVVGVGIDLDHFVVTGLKGTWGPVRRCLRDPTLVVAGQADIFEAGDLWPLERLLSHLLVAGPLAALAWWVAPTVGLLTAATLYAHLLADVAWDVVGQDRYHEQVREVGRR